MNVMRKVRRGRITAEHMGALVRPEQLLMAAEPDGHTPIDKPCFSNPTSLLEYMLVRGYDERLREEPIEVVMGSKGNLEIHDGNHRVVAAYEAGLKHIPVNVYYWDGAEEMHVLVGGVV